MLNYYVKRSLIAINQRKRYFLLPVVVTVGFIFVRYAVTPQQYVIKSVYIPPATTVNLTQPDGSCLNETDLWELALSEISIGPQFLASLVREDSKEMMSLLPEIVAESALTIGSPSESLTRRKFRRLKRDVIRFIIAHVTMELVTVPDRNLSRVVFYYRGTNRELGKKLISFYSRKLLPSWKRELEKKNGRVLLIINRLRERLDSDVSGTLARKIHDYLSIQKKYEYMLLLLDNSVSSPQVIRQPRVVSDRIMAGGFYCLLFSTLLVLCVVLFAEFSGRTFTTELQVSQYLNVRLIGSIPPVESLPRRKGEKGKRGG